MRMCFEDRDVPRLAQLHTRWAGLHCYNALQNEVQMNMSESLGRLGEAGSRECYF